MPVHACLSAYKGTALRKGGPRDRWAKSRVDLTKMAFLSGVAGAGNEKRECGSM